MGILSTVISLLFSPPSPAEAGSANAGVPPGQASATALSGAADPFADPLAAAQDTDARERLDWRATFFDYL
jgi:hypothetical protein